MNHQRSSTSSNDQCSKTSSMKKRSKKENEYSKRQQAAGRSRSADNSARKTPKTPETSRKREAEVSEDDTPTTSNVTRRIRRKTEVYNPECRTKDKFKGIRALMSNEERSKGNSLKSANDSKATPEDEEENEELTEKQDVDNEKEGTSDREDDKEYDVLAIMDNMENDDSNMEYCIYWTGYEEEKDATWETEERLANAKEILETYNIGQHGLQMLISINKRIEDEKYPRKYRHLNQWHEGEDTKYWQLKLWGVRTNIQVTSAGHAPLFIEDWLNSVNKKRIPEFEFITEMKYSKKALKLIEAKKKNMGKIEPCPCKMNRLGGCCTGGSESNAAYDNDRLVVDEQTPKGTAFVVYECNSSCPCDNQCPRRLTQRHRKVPLIIFNFAKKGWGLVAADKIEKGQYVTEYLGEMKTIDEAGDDPTYDFILDINAGDINDGRMFSIDAIKYGNESRLLNSSCDPNLIPVRVYEEHKHLDGFYKICFFADRDIAAGEELTLSYGELENCRCDPCQDKEERKRLENARETRQRTNTIN